MKNKLSEISLTCLKVTLCCLSIPISLFFWDPTAAPKIFEWADSEED